MEPVLQSRVFIHRSRRGKPHFDYPVQPVGNTPHFDVYSVPSLGPNGVLTAQAALENCEKDYQTLCQYFGVAPAHFNIILAPLSPDQDGTGGAYHHTCLAADLYCDVQFHPTVVANFTNALVIAEEVEVMQAVQNKGWNCGGSNGEGLSRVLAEVMYPGVIGGGYLTASDWLDGGRPDWVNRNDNTDRDGVSTGCAVLFLYWLHDQLKFGWDKICQAGAPTLAQTYKTLTKGNDDPFPKFKGLLDTHFPPGRPSGLNSDNPFPL